MVPLFLSELGRDRRLGHRVHRPLRLLVHLREKAGEEGEGPEEDGQQDDNQHARRGERRALQAARLRVDHGVPHGLGADGRAAQGQEDLDTCFGKEGKEDDERRGGPSKDKDKQAQARALRKEGGQEVTDSGRGCVGVKKVMMDGWKAPTTAGFGFNGFNSLRALPIFCVLSPAPTPIPSNATYQESAGGRRHCGPHQGGECRQEQKWRPFFLESFGGESVRLLEREEGRIERVC